MNIKEEKKEVKIFWVTKGRSHFLTYFLLWPHVMYHKPLDLDTQMLPENGRELILNDVFNIKMFHFEFVATLILCKGHREKGLSLK